MILYDGAHNDLLQLDFFDANLILSISFNAKLNFQKRNLDSSDANLKSQKHKLDYFYANLNSTRRKLEFTKPQATQTKRQKSTKGIFLKISVGWGGGWGNVR